MRTLSLFLSLFSTLSFCITDMKHLANMNAYETYGFIDRAKIAAFSTDSFQRSGADAKGVVVWNDLTYACNQLVLKESKKSELLKYSRYLYELDQARLYILDTIEALHAKKKPDTNAIAQKHLLAMYAIEGECFAEICKNSKPGRDWTSKIPHGQVLTAKHQALLDGYVILARQTERDGHPVSERELQGLLKMHQIQNKIAANILVDNLEQYCYKKEKHHQYARALISDLKGLFPDIFSSFELNLLAHTKDKPNVIIFAQSGAYENILRQILRELH